MKKVLALLPLGTCAAPGANGPSDAPARERYGSDASNNSSLIVSIRRGPVGLQIEQE